MSDLPEKPAVETAPAPEIPVTVVDPASLEPQAAAVKPGLTRNRRFLIRAGLADPATTRVLMVAALSVTLGWASANVWNAAVQTSGRDGGIARLASLEKSFAAFSGDMRTLKDTTQELAARPQKAADVLQVMQGRIGNLAEVVDKARAEQQSRLAAPIDRIEKREKEAAEQMTLLSTRLDRIERQTSVLATGSTGAAGTGRSDAGLQPLPGRPKLPEPPKADPAQVRLEGWRLSEIDDGVAVIENTRGQVLEVAPGETVPGAGKVRKLEKRGKAWVVLTEKGYIGR